MLEETNAWFLCCSFVLASKKSKSNHYLFTDCFGSQCTLVPNFIKQILPSNTRGSFHKAILALLSSFVGAIMILTFSYD